MKRSDSAWAVVIGASSALAASNPLTQNDLFWHLELGRAVLMTGSRIVSEPWSIFGAERLRVVPEWLWAAVLYCVDRRFGMTGIHVLVLACAALLGLALLTLIRDVADEHRSPLTPLVPLAALAAAAINARLNERPETFALVSLAFVLVLARKFARASGSSALRWGACIVALEILHAQIHGTFVLIPVLVGFASIKRVLQRDASFFRPLAFTAVALLLGALTSAYGLDLRAYLVSHTHGDAVRHIMDMNSPAWAAVNPAERPYFGYYFALLGISLVLAAAHRRASLNATLCAALGLMLLATAVRAVGLAALLTLPLALESAAGLCAELPFSKVRSAGFASLAVLICIGDLFLNDGKGESKLLQLGFDYDRVPVASARFISSSRVRERVLASFAAGAPLAYLAHGRANVLMDSRTPLHFDDTQYALLRDSFRSLRQLEKAVHWFDITAVVVRQQQAECELIAQSERFVPAVVEWDYTTFVRREEASLKRPLATLTPCAREGRIRIDRCSREFDGEFERDLKQTTFSSNAFAGVLRAERALRCGATAQELEALPAWLEAVPSGRGPRPEQTLWLAIGLSRIAQHEAALKLLSKLALAGHVPAASAMAASLAHVAPRRVRALVEPIAERYEDALPIALRLALARACVATNDPACARFHGLRAFLGSGDEALPILRWIAAQSPELAHDDQLQRALRLRAAP
jgi:hypothetical protein